MAVYSTSFCVNKSVMCYVQGTFVCDLYYLNSQPVHLYTYILTSSLKPCSRVAALFTRSRYFRQKARVQAFHTAVKPNPATGTYHVRLCIQFYIHVMCKII